MDTGEGMNEQGQMIGTAVGAIGILGLSIAGLAWLSSDDNPDEEEQEHPIPDEGEKNNPAPKIKKPERVDDPEKRDLENMVDGWKNKKGDRRGSFAAAGGWKSNPLFQKRKKI